MSKWNCFTPSGCYAGTVEAASADDAIKVATDEFEVKIDRAELRTVLEAADRYGKG